MSDWILQIRDQCLPVQAQAVVEVIRIVRLPHEHIRSLSGLRQSVELCIHLLNTRAVCAFSCFENNRVAPLVNIRVGSQ